MIKFTFLCFLTAATLGANAQQKIKDGTGTPITSLPAAGSILELQSTQAGLRFPQVSLTDTKAWAPLLGSGAAATSPGMTVYNTNAVIANAAGDANYPALGIGEYYWDGTGWIGKNAITSKEYLEASAGAFSAVNPTGSNFAQTMLAYNSPTGSITYTSNSITLKAGKRYRLLYNPGDVSSSGGYGTYGWYNLTASTAVGHMGFVYSNGTTLTSNDAVAIVQPVVTTTYNIRWVVYTAISLGLGGYTGPYCVVETLP